MITKSRWLARWCAIGMFLLLFALLLLGARRLSMTQDEPAHIVAGYTLLARGRAGFWTFFQRGHPPLINLLEGLLLYLSRSDVPLESLEGWGSNYVQYVAAWRPYLMPIERTEFLGRAPVILLTLLLAATIYRWARRLGGRGAATLTLLALALDPLLLAHGRLATNDLGVTALGTVALYLAWRWMQRPLWRYALLTGLLLGLTALAKASGVIWVLAFIGLATLRLKTARRYRRHLATQSIAALLMAGGVVWGAYGFSFGRVTGLPLPVPAPEHWGHWLRHTSVPSWRVFWGLGQMWQGRQWWYYPLNWLIRNPLPFLVGLAIGGWALLKRRLDPILIFPLLYTLFALFLGTSVGYRHILPLHPFLYLLWGLGLWSWAWRGARWRWGLVAALSLTYAVETLRFFPDEIAYFNQLVGGPQQGYRYLVDYTQDWGQSFKALRDWLTNHPGPEPNVAYFTYIPPDFYGLDFVPLPPAEGAEPLPTPFRPPPGRYVIGVTPLQGVVGRDRMTFEWFRHVTPTAYVGQALHVYDVLPFDGSWLAQCHTPAPPLSRDAIQSNLRDDLRLVYFDCTQAWVYPGGGTAGWYALHGQRYAPNGLKQRLLYAPPRPRDAFLSRHLHVARFAYQQEQAGLLPPFVLYEVAGPSPRPPAARAWMAPADTPPDALPPAEAIAAPLPLDGPLTLVSVQFFKDDTALQVETWWQVTQGPVTRPLSLMAHLVSADGQTLAVGDGLGVSPLMWQPGDILVQRHNFPLPPEGTRPWLRTGAYWLDDGGRWTVAGAPNADALFVPLDP